MSQLAFRTANGRISSFSDAFELIRCDYRQAMECRDCEDVLRLGIEALQWIQRAHENVRVNILAGHTEFDPKIEEAITLLYEHWLEPCENVEKWIALHLERGYKPDNLAEFRKCEEEAADILEQRTLAHKARCARMAQLDEG